MSSLNGSFDEDDFMSDGHGPRIASQRFDSSSFTNFEAELGKDSAGDSSPVYTSQSYSGGGEPIPDTPSPIYSAGAGDGFSSYSTGQNGGFDSTEGSVLPPPADMPPEEGFALREWRR